ncbi:kinase-like domain-containing protein [Cristinia sonorae]|uniref:Kinase-like domain-containing protein n=1 Tax=Cristinia sonorae TaxID=1940300 RepID=A0A8K0UH28_9AGAR|nr:kinase-like domain-containing protein [Cristinia sonorae]
MSFNSNTTNLAPSRLSRPKYDPTVLAPHEAFWRDHALWLKERGYQLRPRFQPGWVPSWLHGNSQDFLSMFEDRLVPMRGNIMDAVRISDGEMVAFKLISRDVHPYEVEISEFLNSEPLRSDPKNHCVPIIEVLEVPEQPNSFILVMPFLRFFDSPPFQTVGEVLEFLRQLFEGLQFMHHHHVAHRDCMGLNIMMDPRPMYPDMYHPDAWLLTRDLKHTAKYHSRTARPVRYYLIDFGLSRKYDATNTSPMEWPIWGGDKTVPEFQESDDECNPFPTDIYYLGNMIREYFFKKTDCLRFLSPLVDDMVQADPTKRPTIDQVVERFDALLLSVSSWRMRDRILYSRPTKLGHLLHGLPHVVRSLKHVIMRRKAMPTPPATAMHTFTL